MRASRIRQFRKVLREFERLNESINYACCMSVTMTQCHVILEIADNGEATTVQLAKELNLDKSTLSRTVDALVKEGMIERKDSSADRRFTPLVLTEQGKTICKEINEAGDRRYAQALKDLKERDIGELTRQFALLAKAMREAGKPASECPPDS